MTSGLREFVLRAPAAAGPQPARDLLPAVLSALGESFTVTEEPGARGSGAHRRIWLDTFDWRLWRAGLVLTYEHDRRGGRLLLTQADGTPQAQQPTEQPVTGWPLRRPRLATDLPEGQLRDRIDVLTSPRALLPIIRATGHVRVFRLLNADTKTVARLYADESSATAIAAPAEPASGTTATLPLRLSIAEVRGYPAQARRAATVLATVPGLEHATHSAFTEALTALGRHPADRNTSKAEAEITADMPAPAAVAGLLLRLLDTIELNVDGVLRDIDTEFLHDLRVAVRRTRSAIKLLHSALPAELTRQFATEFKWLGDLTTPVRDLDVHLLGFDAMAGQLRAASPADLEPFRAFLIRRRGREFRRLAVGLRGPRFRAILDDWRKALLTVLDTGAAAPDTRKSRRANPGQPPQTAGALAIATTGRSFKRIAAQGGAITAESPPESLHDLRKRCKELRYLLEFFASLHDPVAYRKVVGDLKQLQDCLGEFQDSQVQREEIHTLADAMLTDSIHGKWVTPAATLLAMGEVNARLAVSQTEARDAFARRFARFAGPAGRDRFRALLTQGAGSAQ